MNQENNKSKNNRGGLVPYKTTSGIQQEDIKGAGHTEHQHNFQRQGNKTNKKKPKRSMRWWAINRTSSYSKQVDNTTTDQKRRRDNPQRHDIGEGGRANEGKEGWTTNYKDDKV